MKASYLYYFKIEDDVWVYQDGDEYASCALTRKKKYFVVRVNSEKETIEIKKGDEVIELPIFKMEAVQI